MTTLYSSNTQRPLLHTRSKSKFCNPSSSSPLVPFPTQRHGFNLSMIQTVQFADIGRRSCSIIHSTKDSDPQPGAPQPARPNLLARLNQIFGLILWLVPFANLRGGNLHLGGTLSRVEEVVEVVEDVAEVVETVADAVGKVSSVVAENLPNDGILRKTALSIEHLSEEVEKDAKLVLEVTEKVEEIKEDMEKREKTLVTLKVVSEVIVERNEAHRKRS